MQSTAHLLLLLLLTALSSVVAQTEDHLSYFRHSEDPFYYSYIYFIMTCALIGTFFLLATISFKQLSDKYTYGL